MFRFTRTDVSSLPLRRKLDYLVDLCGRLVDRIPNLMVTLGEAGILVCRRTPNHNQKFPTRGKLSLVSI